MKRLLVSLLLFALIFSFVSCGDKKQTEAEKHSAGEEFTVENWKVKLGSVEFSQSVSIGNNLNQTAEEGKKFAVVRMELTNTGDEKDFFTGLVEMDGEFVIRLIAGNNEYKPTLTMNKNEDLYSRQIEPNETASGFMAFVVTQEDADAGSPVFRIDTGSAVYEVALG